MGMTRHNHENAYLCWPPFSTLQIANIDAIVDIQHLNLVRGIDGRRRNKCRQVLGILAAEVRMALHLPRQPRDRISAATFAALPRQYERFAARLHVVLTQNVVGRQHIDAQVALEKVIPHQADLLAAGKLDNQGVLRCDSNVARKKAKLDGNENVFPLQAEIGCRKRISDSRRAPGPNFQ